MVVQGLEGFMEKALFTKTESLEEIIRDGVQGAAVVVDLSHASFSFYKGLPFLYSGQFVELKKRVHDFAARIISLGARLVVFIPTCSFQPTRLDKKKESLKRMFEVFDKLEQGVEEKECPFPLPTVRTCLYNTFAEIEDCEIIHPSGDFPSAILKYTQDHTCVALLAQNSSYIVCNMAPIYISLKHFDLVTFQSISYQKQEFLNLVQLNEEQLYLFATLLGNDIVKISDVLPFLLKLINHTKLTFIPSGLRASVYKHLANYVRRFPSPCGEKDILQISRDVCGSFKLRADIENSLKKFKGDLEEMQGEEKTELEKVVEEMQQRHELRSFVLNLLQKNLFLCHFDLQDYRDLAFQPACRVFRPLRRKLYGIVLQDSQANSVTEWCIEGTRAPHSGEFIMQPVEVRAEAPLAPHPGLLRLLQDNSPEMQAIKWNLFCSVISEDIDIEQIKDLPQTLTLPTLALLYLQEHSYFWASSLEAFELKSFVVTALLVEYGQLSSIEPVQLSDKRAVQLSSIYMNCLSTINMLNSVCGFVIPRKKTCVCLSYEGHVFHHVYKNMQQGQTAEDFFRGNIVIQALCTSIMEVAGL